MSSATPMVNLSPIAGTFSFKAKYIPLAAGTKVILGSQTSDNGTARTATTTNGWFAPNTAGATPLPLSSSHAQVWFDQGKIFIRDLDSPFGTFVNGTKLSTPIELKNGDTIVNIISRLFRLDASDRNLKSLGSTISRNSNTPVYITDDHLKPIIGRVALVGVAP